MNSPPKMNCNAVFLPVPLNPSAHEFCFAPCQNQQPKGNLRIKLD